jgi:hypothetical protein
MDSPMWHLLNETTVFGLLLLSIVPFAWREAWFAYASRRWPTTPARLHYLGMSGPGGTEGYAPAARYSYTVDGLTYESTRWRFGGTAKVTPGPAQEMSMEIKPIGPVVFYDPHKPSRSCLVAGPGETTLPGAILFSIVGLTLVVVGIR